MSDEYLDEELCEHEATMKVIKDRQEADQMATVKRHEAAMQAMKDNQVSEMKSLIKRNEEEISAAMQEFETKVAARRLYHEAPNDVFELFVMCFPDADEVEMWGKGGLNVLRLVSKRCMQVAESLATRLTSKVAVKKITSAVMKRCKRIEHIRCDGHYLVSLDMCPDVLIKSLIIDRGDRLKDLDHLSICKELETLQIYVSNFSDLSPLSACTRLKRLSLTHSRVSDLTSLSSLPLLEELDLSSGQVFSQFKDLSPLLLCKRLRKLNIGRNRDISMKELGSLSQCPDLEELSIYGQYRIISISFFEKGFTKLRFLDISDLVKLVDLSPLTKLHSLEELNCNDIGSGTSLLPLSRCCKLKKLIYDQYARDVHELKEMRPELEMTDPREAQDSSEEASDRPA